MPPLWSPPVEPSLVEERILGRCKKAKFYVLLRRFSSVPASSRSVSSSSSMRHVGSLKDQVAAMQTELGAEIARIEAEFDANTIRVEIVPVRPKKSDISVEDMALVWCP